MLSLRDPDGFLFEQNSRLFRHVQNAAAGRIDGFLSSGSYRTLCDRGLFIRTMPADGVAVPEAAVPAHFAGMPGKTVEHERIGFASYPCEWHPAMLADAARATLEILYQILPDGLTLKDATPYNVLFRGPEPVFVDLLSIDSQPAGYPFWLAEAQYIRTFALPLMAYSRAGLSPKQVFLASRDGIEPAAVARWTRPRDLLRLSHWLYAGLPALAAKRAARQDMEAAYRRETSIAPARARFIYAKTLERHARLLDRIACFSHPSSDWAGYTATRSHYETAALERKREMIARIHAKLRPRRVLDVGANTGEFAEIAAQSGSSVVAVDADLDSVGMTYTRARRSNLDILPLHVNFANPTPATGWQGKETAAFTQRARGNFDCVLMLAVIHHLVVSEGIPLDMLLGEVARTTTDLLVIEQVSPDDPMCKALLRGRDFLGRQLEHPAFEDALRRHFTIEHSEVLIPGRRTLYLCRKPA